MSDIIRLLPDNVANQIAAGEVIQRPASVIKELVENAIDAGATDIKVVLIDAGRTLIQVVDNGCGMSHTDARMSFERHATSKITKAEDIYALTTKGFRGEALASIAAVAQIELRTRQHGEDVGTLLEVEGSQVVRHEVVSCPQGSNFAIRNLFYNIPVRRKFLKTDKTEMSQILGELQRMVLVHPDISFSLTSNEQLLLRLSPTSLKSRIIEIFGNRLSSQLLSLNVEMPLVSINGYVGKIDSARKRGAETYFFVNNRYMRHPYFHKAVMEAFSRLIPDGETVPYFIYLTVSPEDIDVNIHPTKTEIKFEHEQAIFQLLLISVKELIGKSELMPTIDFDTEDRIEIPIAAPLSSSSSCAFSPMLPTDPSYDPFAAYINRTERQSEHIEHSEHVAREKAYHTDMFMPPDEEPHGYSLRPEEGYKSMYIKGRWILVTVRSGLMLIDARRAHIQVLYEKYCEQIDKRQPACGQQLLFPEAVEVSPIEEAVLHEMMPDLEALGFDICHLGGRSYSINAVPSERAASTVSPVMLLSELLHASIETGESPVKSINRDVALALAQSSAITYGQELGQAEVSHLISSLFASSNCSHTPTGKRIFTILSTEDLDKLL